MLHQLLGASPVFAAVREELARLLARPAVSPKRLPPVLIQGETGTGKGLVAHVIHEMGPRAEAPFVDINCAAIPDALLEAELFGFERGAFTDAKQAKAGLLQVAHRGTIFLDEIGLMPDSLQVKMLKALEDRSVRRLGSTRAEPADAWVLAQPLLVDPVEVGDNVLVGANVTLLRGARIGRNSVVAAGAVVMAGEYPTGWVIGGTPAKPLKSLGG